MKFKTYIIELFNKPYEYTKKGKSTGDDMYTFYADNGKFIVEIQKFEKFIKDKWRIGLYVTFTKNGSYKLSKFENPFRVFSTVADIIMKYPLQSSSINFIEFSAFKSESDRIKLYNKFDKKIQKELKWSSIAVEDEAHNIYFTIYK